MGGTPSLSRTLLSFKGFAASPALGLGRVVPRCPSAGGGDLLFPSRQGGHLYSAEGRLCSLPFGLPFFFFFFGFSFFFRSLSKVTALPPTHQIPHLPLESYCSSPRSCWPSAPGLENISGPGPPPGSLHPHRPPSPTIRHPSGCWVSAQSYLWTNTVSSLTMRISKDPFTFLEKLPFNFVSMLFLFFCFFFFGGEWDV